MTKDKKTASITPPVVPTLKAKFTLTLRTNGVETGKEKFNTAQQAQGWAKIKGYTVD